MTAREKKQEVEVLFHEMGYVFRRIMKNVGIMMTDVLSFSVKDSKSGLSKSFVSTVHAPGTPNHNKEVFCVRVSRGKVECRVPNRSLKCILEKELGILKEGLLSGREIIFT
ncbi:MAG: hypothetical protein UW95_C0009G0015 [Parcubacteria group bacterium GW2011_GWC1_45_14]|nr:MAG: hypothetical protein UW87_C0025G0014 [Candidatus Moranbacteria bacterium GW2011_GWC2_45_10]KKT94748.1 MAG: hypothetical protein UW95_C0009G0015 [Parcubacteria group bacterium GW2011_GWC1_45_14]